MPRTCLPYMFFILITPNCAQSVLVRIGEQLERKRHLGLEVLVRLERVARDAGDHGAGLGESLRAGRGTRRPRSCSRACCPSDRSRARPVLPAWSDRWNVPPVRGGFEVGDFLAGMWGLLVAGVGGGGLHREVGGRGGSPVRISPGGARDRRRRGIPAPAAARCRRVRAAYQTPTSQRGSARGSTASRRARTGTSA